MIEYGPDCYTMRALILLSIVLFCSPAMAGDECLAEVNAARAARGLRPFVKDDWLTAGAVNVADVRAAHLWEWHTRNDFNGLPIGTTATAAGCAAAQPSRGFLACCTYENWTYAGAAKTMGKDGRYYYQLFVR